MSHQLIYAANWKMNFTTRQAVNFLAAHKNALAALNGTIILCAGAPALTRLHEQLAGSRLSLGAQDCSNQQKGAYTGQISASDLSDIGCSYCIVGHSERRKYNNESSEVVAQKTVRLLENKITPIVCVGESDKSTTEMLDIDGIQTIHQQLAPVIQECKRSTLFRNIIIAYEPVWAIGTGLVASPTHIQQVLELINEIVSLELKDWNIQLLYGGSVSSNNIASLKQIELLKGFLVGGASLDFQEFEKLVNLI